MPVQVLNSGEGTFAHAIETSDSGGMANLIPDAVNEAQICASRYVIAHAFASETVSSMRPVMRCVPAGGQKQRHEEKMGPRQAGWSSNPQKPGQPEQFGQNRSGAGPQEAGSSGQQEQSKANARKQGSRSEGAGQPARDSLPPGMSQARGKGHMQSWPDPTRFANSARNLCPIDMVFHDLQKAAAMIPSVSTEPSISSNNS